MDFDWLSVFLSHIKSLQKRLHRYHSPQSLVPAVVWTKPYIYTETIVQLMLWATSGWVQTKCGAVARNAAFPLWSGCGDDFCLRLARHLKLRLVQVFSGRAPRPAASANHVSKQSNTDATHQTTRLDVTQWVLFCLITPELPPPQPHNIWNTCGLMSALRIFQILLFNVKYCHAV